jgi:adenylyltransferase/sulfurtransferase
LFVEELCGRDRGKRTFSITPAGLLSIDVKTVQNKAAKSGFNVESNGSMGVTMKQNGKLSFSLLQSGAAVIVGAKDENDALSIYKEFVIV